MHHTQVRIIGFYKKLNLKVWKMSLYENLYSVIVVEIKILEEQSPLLPPVLLPLREI